MKKIILLLCLFLGGCNVVFVPVRNPHPRTFIVIEDNHRGHGHHGHGRHEHHHHKRWRRY